MTWAVKTPSIAPKKDLDWGREEALDCSGKGPEEAVDYVGKRSLRGMDSETGRGSLRGYKTTGVLERMVGLSGLDRPFQPINFTTTVGACFSFNLSINQGVEGGSPIFVNPLSRSNYGLSYKTCILVRTDVR